MVYESMTIIIGREVIDIKGSCGHSHQMVFEVLVKGLIGLQPGDEMQFLKKQFQEFIAGLISLPVKLPGTRLYRSLQASPSLYKNQATLPDLALTGTMF